MTKHWYSNRTQIFWTCEALLAGRTITHKTEIREVRGWRLGAIVHSLKKNYGWPIEADYRGADNIAHYWLKKGADPTTFRFPRSAKDLDPKGGDQ